MFQFQQDSFSKFIEFLPTFAGISNRKRNRPTGKSLQWEQLQLLFWIVFCVLSIKYFECISYETYTLPVMV